VQQVGQATTDDLVVVEQEDTNHDSFLPAGDPPTKGRRSRRAEPLHVLTFRAGRIARITVFLRD
jgi:hypothetical protein